MNERKRIAVMEGGTSCKNCKRYILSRTDLSKNFYAGPVCLCPEPDPIMPEEKPSYTSEILTGIARIAHMRKYNDKKDNFALNAVSSR